MKSIVISLPHALERRKRIAQRFVELDLPFEFMDAVDAREPTDADIAAVDTRYRRRWGCGLWHRPNSLAGALTSARSARPELAPIR